MFLACSFSRLFMPFASANVVSTVYDITLPEVRSTALSIQYFMENFGAAMAPLLAGFIARAYNCTPPSWYLHDDLGVGGIHSALMPACTLRYRCTARQMRERAELERSSQGA